MGIIWIFIIAVVAVLIFYAISSRSRKDVPEETETPERTPAPPTVSKAAPPAETGEKKEEEGSPSPPPPPPNAL
ncbi:MAG: hypothetical protein U9N73_03040 [Candidatus Auribacterota bacterium]|nr:hypothetical protein [Candidatus Auribacterota bacterium]